MRMALWDGELLRALSHGAMCCGRGLCCLLVKQTFLFRLFTLGPFMLGIVMTRAVGLAPKRLRPAEVEACVARVAYGPHTEHPMFEKLRSVARAPVWWLRLGSFYRRRQAKP